MTDDIKATRLSKAAREFNVGISTIVEFLHKKGFDLDSNPNTKLPHDAYILLVKEYSTDISVKKESEKLILKDLHRKKESVSIDDFSEKNETEESEKEDEILIKDSTGVNTGVDIKTEIKKPDIKLVGKIDLEKTLKPKVEDKEKEVIPPKVVPEEEPEKALPEPEKTENEKAVTEEVSEKKKPKSNIDIHIVGKIDLDTIAKEARPAKREEHKESKKEKTREKEKEIVPTPKKKAKVEEEIPKTSNDETPEIPVDKETIPEEEETILSDSLPDMEEDIIELYRTNFKKLSGPTVVGKIDLPLEEKKKATPFQPVKVSGGADFRRKKRRKRISKEKEVSPVVKPVLPADNKDKQGKKLVRKRPLRAEVNEEEVQKQIKETLARLTTKGKSKGSRYRREKERQSARSIRR